MSGGWDMGKMWDYGYGLGPIQNSVFFVCLSFSTSSFTKIQCMFIRNIAKTVMLLAKQEKDFVSTVEPEHISAPQSLVRLSIRIRKMLYLGWCHATLTVPKGIFWMLSISQSNLQLDYLKIFLPGLKSWRVKKLYGSSGNKFHCIVLWWTFPVYSLTEQERHIFWF